MPCPPPAADGGSAEEDDLLTALERQQLRAALLRLRRQRLLAALGLPLGLAGDGDGGAAELPDMSYEVPPPRPARRAVPLSFSTV